MYGEEDEAGVAKMQNEGFQVDESVDYTAEEGVFMKARRDLCYLLVFYD